MSSAADRAHETALADKANASAFSVATKGFYGLVAVAVIGGSFGLANSVYNHLEPPAQNAPTVDCITQISRYHDIIKDDPTVLIPIEPTVSDQCPGILEFVIGDEKYYQQLRIAAPQPATAPHT